LDILTIGWLGFVALLAFVILGIRIAFAAALVGFLGIWMVKDISVAARVVGFTPFEGVATYSLSVIPLFILMGYFALNSGVTGDIYFVGRQLFGHLSAGLGIATVFGSALFGACTGSSVAAAVMIGKIAIPEMKKYGYKPRFAAATVAASGTLASLIPPSITLVVYGMISGQSISALLIAGVIPGIFSAIVYSVLIWTRVKISPGLCQRLPNVSWKDKFSALKKSWGVVCILIIIIGGLYFGIFTPTEAGGAGAFATFLMALGMRKLSFPELRKALLETAQNSIMVFALIFGFLIFIRFLALTGVPYSFAEFVNGLQVPRLFIMVGILFIYFFLGMFVNTIPMLMMTLPVIYPMAVALGYDPIWFGIIITMLCDIGLLTPPVGMNVYVVGSVAPDIPIEDIFKSAIPFVIAQFFVILVLFIFPEIATFLPSKMARF